MRQGISSMRHPSAGPSPDGKVAVDLERPTGHPLPRYEVKRGTRRGRLVWARMAMMLVMMAQLAVGVIAPIVHARAESSVGAHLETQGADRHYIHDEGRCAVCAAHHVAAVVAPLPPSLPLSRSRASVPPPVSEQPLQRDRHTPAAPRAPPAVTRIV